VQKEQKIYFWLVLDISGLAKVQVMKSDCEAVLPKIRFTLVGRISYIKNHFARATAFKNHEMEDTIGIWN